MTATAQTIDPRDAILTALDRWIRQRPGLEFGNYGDWSAYRAEVRSIGRDLAHARTLLAYVERHPSIDAERLTAAFRDAYSGRLSLRENSAADRKAFAPCVPRFSLDYCTGQYWPTEYRKAACAVLASAIWNWWRDECMPEYESIHGVAGAGKPVVPGDWLRANARREFGNSIAARWFN